MKRRGPERGFLGVLAPTRALIGRQTEFRRRARSCHCVVLRSPFGRAAGRLLGRDLGPNGVDGVRSQSLCLASTCPSRLETGAPSAQWYRYADAGEMSPASDGVRSEVAVRMGGAGKGSIWKAGEQERSRQSPVLPAFLSSRSSLRPVFSTEPVRLGVGRGDRHFGSHIKRGRCLKNGPGPDCIRPLWTAPHKADPSVVSSPLPGG